MLASIAQMMLYNFIMSKRNNIIKSFGYAGNGGSWKLLKQSQLQISTVVGIIVLFGFFFSILGYKNLQF